MTDIIRMLPESVANQIAAGEVVQRPASAVKELLENTIDAGATEVKLVIKEAGRALIHVIDNGCGMSERDARMCFERHATSKIQTVHDLLSIRTLGFRGEALASIASVAQVELRTKKAEDEIGTQLIIEGTEVRNHSPVNTPNGTSIQVKNLFFNVPARRNFLKSNTSELKYILDEFYRIALVHPDIAFTMYNQEKVMFQLPSANLRQRIVALFGSNYNQRLIPVEQQTNMVNISGFIGKPEFSKKTRGEQFFFANGRYIRNPYLHHAVEAAFKELIPKDSFASYFLYLELDPGNIDVNIHPTKTEINFTDSKSIYAILQAAIRQSLGKYNLTTVLDFEQEQSMDIPPLKPGQTIRPPQITINPGYNPFEKKQEFQPSFRFENPGRIQTGDARKDNFQPAFNQPGTIPSGPLANLIDKLNEGEEVQLNLACDNASHAMFQIANSYIVTEAPKGLLIIDQQAAHERILYEEMLEAGAGSNNLRSSIMPETLSFSPDDALLLTDLLGDFNALGFEISEFGNNDFVLQSIPHDLGHNDFHGAVEQALEAIKNELPGRNAGKQQMIARTMAKTVAIRRGKPLNKEEMEAIHQKLFACKIPELSPYGKPAFFVLSFDELSKKFKT
ncbi:MAG: DNA mismatch repair endonuclease MutL [Bacteroidetes bacterium]|nr:DNA mismatch repair endonuclease MutL [Bacteroidota bacterium]